MDASSVKKSSKRTLILSASNLPKVSAIKTAVREEAVEEVDVEVVEVAGAVVTTVMTTIAVVVAIVVTIVVAVVTLATIVVAVVTIATIVAVEVDTKTTIEVVGVATKIEEVDVNITKITTTIGEAVAAAFSPSQLAIP